MPTISAFFGILIQMYWRDHPPPHVHAIYGGYEALFAIRTGDIIGGRLPPKASAIVREWVLQKPGGPAGQLGARTKPAAIRENPGSGFRCLRW